MFVKTGLNKQGGIENRDRILFPRGQTIHLSFWDYNDVAPAYFAAAEIAAREQKLPRIGNFSPDSAIDSNPPLGDN